MLNNVGVIVIANEGRIRNYHQLNDGFFSKFSKSYVFCALTPLVLGCENLDVFHTHSNSLTCNEFAASLSHKVARNYSIVFELDWVLFLEDDAILSDNFFTVLDDLIKSQNFTEKKMAFPFSQSNLGF